MEVSQYPFLKKYQWIYITLLGPTLFGFTKIRQKTHYSHPDLTIRTKHWVEMKIKAVRLNQVWMWGYTLSGWRKFVDIIY